MTRNKFKLHDLSWVNRLKIILLTLTISIITPLPASQNIAEAIPTPKKISRAMDSGGPITAKINCLGR